MRKLLFLCLVLAVSAGAQVAEDSNWSHVKSLYQAGQPSEVQFSETGDLGPSSPTLTPLPEQASRFAWSLIQRAKQEYPDLEIWRDSAFLELEALGDRGIFGDAWAKIKSWLQEHVQLAFGAGIGLQFSGDDGGCIIIMWIPPNTLIILPC
ncbi:MAG: hypothetical protein QF492_00540 [Candidatus Krumholzibacteria bacterium]|jgi:hypothetical protein|nr:hypothetical protein [Candidatus Krumholzibacteria bacterium]MDP6797427.1 hypothetical protein [Candidatus Krumholzibacteria bacterium]MDP7022168.1 hypothetical protein [Candidatus Krumholzibacteria bacterium]